MYMKRAILNILEPGADWSTLQTSQVIQAIEAAAVKSSQIVHSVDHMEFRITRNHRIQVSLVDVYGTHHEVGEF